MAASLNELSTIVREVLQDNGLVIEAATRFEDLPTWNPMDLLAVVVEAECRYDLQFELTEIDRLVTAGDLLQMIMAKQALAAA